MKNGDNRMKNVTMADIANALGVSNVTVSNALSGKKGVSEKLRMAIQMKARELGYINERIITDEEPAEFQVPQTGSIGIIAFQRYLNNERGFHWQLYQELITQLKNYDSYAILDVISEEDEKNIRIPKMIEKHIVSSIIVLGKPNLIFLSEICKAGIPLIFVDFCMRDFDFASIVEDEYYDMYRLTAFLISRGHSNVCYVAENMDEIKWDRYFGYCHAVRENEQSPSKPLLIDQALENFLSEIPTAFLCESRTLAKELIENLNESGNRVPDTVSVACFSDVKTEDSIDLTCVCRDPIQMARLAVDALRSKQTKERKGMGRIAVGGKIIVGSTTRRFY